MSAETIGPGGINSAFRGERDKTGDIEQLKIGEQRTINGEQVRMRDGLSRTAVDSVHGVSSFFKVVPGQFLKYRLSIPQPQGMSREIRRNFFYSITSKIRSSPEVCPPEAAAGSTVTHASPGSRLLSLRKSKVSR
jgi:hypothetical protein